MAKIFFSYSHRDESDRDELEKHLAPLRREGVIESWHDRRIAAGDDFGESIDQHLEEADVILLLISPDFMASDYCHDIEMTRAMERHEDKTARVIPVILDFCQWQQSPFGKLLAVPTDGKPIRQFPNRNEGFLQVADAIRRLFSKPSESRGESSIPSVAKRAVAAPAVPEIRSSNLAVRKSFTDHDRDVFLDEAFEYVAKFFKNSLIALQKRNPEISTRFKRIDGNRFAAHLYRGGTSIGECCIRLGDMMGKGIAYSSSTDSTNSFNEHFSVADNGSALFLKSMGFSGFGVRRDQELSFEGAAEQLWDMLIRPLK